MNNQESLPALRLATVWVVAAFVSIGLLSSCASSLAPNAVALALDPLRSTPDAQGTVALATFAAALAAPSGALPPPSTPISTETPTPIPTPTATPSPPATPDLAATEVALGEQIQLAVAATLAAQATLAPTQTASPLPDAATAAGGMQMVAIVDGGGLVNLRTGPSTDYPVLTGVDSGEEVLILGRDQEASWFYIRTANSSLGWMSALYVRTVQTPQSYPVVVATALPAAPAAPLLGRP